MIAQRFFLYGRKYTPRLLAIHTNQFIRYQSLKKSTPLSRISEIKDQKLREIIEGTNLGLEALKQKQEDELLKRKSDEETKEGIETRQPQAEKSSQNNDDKDESKPKNVVENSPKRLTGQRTLKGEQANLRFDTTNPSKVMKEINDAIQKEIGNLPSQIEKTRSKMSKKLEEYLDSIQETILTATRALNDVTGYSAIEKLKKSIERLEEELLECKEQVRECKWAYTEAIQRRSDSQREVNELLTRKQNWTTQDLERFTELYRNDHANERLESEAEKHLEEAEQKVDAVQLKLTQLILTRYHEEQIWSDKIRRSSTWGTWILMGINVMLFMVATFFVEPWKRRKLVRAFEEKVKDLLQVQHANEIVETMTRAELEKASIVQLVEPTTEVVEEEATEAVVDGTTESVGLVEAILDKEPREGIEESSDSFSRPVLDTSQKYKNINRIQVLLFNFLRTTWEEFKKVLISNYHALCSPEVTILQFNKLEFEIFLASVTFVACSIGSLLTLCFR